MLILTPGNTADCVMVQECVSLIPGIKELLLIRVTIPMRFALFSNDGKYASSFPANLVAISVSGMRKAYKRRNGIEFCFGRLKDFRRIATRNDRLATKYFLGRLPCRYRRVLALNYLSPDRG